MKFDVSFGPRVKATRFALNGRASKYPWKDMPAPEKDENGEEIFAQFFVPDKTTKQIAGVAYNAAKRLGHKFSVRAAKLEDGTSGVLVQRTE